ncbi:MAG: putative integral membrane protein [Rhodobacteraceae bacterium HLUCCO07]|nr:MAG: putative integral membrane protein [Rhodobacteraceae bacterium HLUCCO07]
MEEAMGLGAPQMRPVEMSMLREALRRGWADMKRAPGFGALFSSAYVIIGLLLAFVTWRTGQTYWLIFAAVGFPLVGPFAAVGLYEVSRRLDRGQALEADRILGVVVRQSSRQLPSICVIIIMMFLFWFFLAHMIFALFLGLSTMTNVSTSFEVYLTPNGLMMLGVGTLVGAIFALLLYMITVISMPLLLDREVDFVTAMITSFQTVTANPFPMLIWAAFIAAITFLAMIPAFLGLFLTLPLLGHASWHLYDQIAIREA